MRYSEIKKPTVPESFFYGELVSWKVSQSVYKNRDYYYFTIELNFSSGKKIARRGEKFRLKNMAVKAREETIVNLKNHNYSPFKYTAQEFYDYWLYYHLIDDVEIKYNTFIIYRGALSKYILPVVGKSYLYNIDTLTIINILHSIKSQYVRHNVMNVLGSSFTFAKSKNYISFNPTKTAFRQLRRMERREEIYKIKSGDFPENGTPTKFKMPSAGEIALILSTCKKKYPDIFIMLLLAFTAGLRISETLGVKYDDVDFVKSEIHILRQIGRPLKVTSGKEKNICSQEISPKTRSSVRSVPIPNFVLDEIIVNRARYEKMRTSQSSFSDNNYINCNQFGKVLNRKFIRSTFKSLLEECNIETFRWHDIRHIYATVLKENKISLKAISIALGHASLSTTSEIYIESSNDILECGTYINAYVNDVIKNESNGYIDYFIPNEYIAEILNLE